MKIKADIILDLGNSETRMSLLLGKQRKDTILSNRFAALPAKYQIPKEYMNAKTTILMVKGAYYAHGYLAEREFGDKLVRPTAVEEKTDQLVTELTMNLVFITALKQLAEGKGVPVSELKVSFNVSVLLPPLEHDINEGKLMELIKSFNSINSLMPVEMNNKFDIDKVQVLPEGVAAFFGVFYNEIDEALVEVPENIKYSTGYVLILDIGAGTTDVVLIKDTELVLNSKETYKKGGNTVESNLKSVIKRKYGFVPQDITNVVSSGILEEGMMQHNVADLLTESKDAYAKMLMMDLREYLERMSISMKEIKGVLVVGGGSLPTIREEKIISPAMSEILLNYFKALAPNITVMSTAGKNPRLLNIEGLRYIHKYS